MFSSYRVSAQISGISLGIILYVLMHLQEWTQAILSALSF